MNEISSQRPNETDLGYQRRIADTIKTYSNPRMEAIVSGWPFGSKRATAYFQIEQTKRGERGTRFLTLNGTRFATKKMTYAAKARIVDGSDGRTYIAELTQYGGHVSITRGDMKIQEETIFPHDSRYATVKRLFDKFESKPTPASDAIGV